MVNWKSKYIKYKLKFEKLNSKNKINGGANTYDDEYEEINPDLSFLTRQVNETEEDDCGEVINPDLSFLTRQANETEEDDYEEVINPDLSFLLRPSAPTHPNVRVPPARTQSRASAQIELPLVEIFATNKDMNFAKFITDLKIEDLIRIREKTYDYISKISTNMVNENNFIEIWRNRIRWVSMLMDTNRFNLTEREKKRYREHIIIYVNNFPLTFESIWGEKDSNFRLIELLECCNIIFMKIDEYKTHNNELYKKLLSQKCKYFFHLAKKINNTNNKSLTTLEKKFLETNTTLKSGSFTGNIQACIAKYYRLIQLFCNNHTEFGTENLERVNSDGWLYWQ
jgi:hypothetical protein